MSFKLDMEIKENLGQTSREGNGSPLQYSCLENPVDRGAWWAAVYGVAQSQTRQSNLAAPATGQTRDILSIITLFIRSHL